MKLFNQARKYGAQVAVGATSLVLAGTASAAEGASPFDALFAAVDFSTVGVAVGAMGVAIIGIVLAYKGIDLVKRAVRKA